MNQQPNVVAFFEYLYEHRATKALADDFAELFSRPGRRNPSGPYARVAPRPHRVAS